MSDVYASFERDHFNKKSKKRQPEFKSNKKNCRGYKVYEPKSSEKQNPKNDESFNQQKPDSSSPNDCQDYDNYESYNEYDDYDSKDNRFDDFEDQRSKNYNKSGKRGTNTNGKYVVWKKEIVKVNKDSILKTHEATPINSNIDGLVDKNSNLFVKEKQSPVNKHLLCEDDTQQLSHKCSGDSVSSASTNATNEDRKSMETLDFANDANSLIQPNATLESILLKVVEAAQKTNGTQAKNRNNVNDQKSQVQEQKENKFSNKLKEKESKDENQVSESLSDQNELNDEIFAKNAEKIGKEGEGKSGKGYEETDESEGERSSNIGPMRGRKLPNNEVGSNSDVCDENGNDSKKGEVDNLEQNEKSSWEGIELKRNISTNKVKIIPNGIFEDDEDNDDDFDQIFSAKQFNKPFYRPNLDTTVQSESLSEKNNCGKPTTSATDLSAILMSPSLKAAKSPEASTSLNGSSHINMLQQFLEQQGNYNFSQTSPTNLPPGFTQLTSMASHSFEDQAAPPGFDKPKFVFKYCGHNYDAKIWFYLDVKGLIQGPYSAKQMDEWYNGNQMKPDLSISRGMGNNSNFKPLEHYVQRAIQREMKNLNFDNDCVYVQNPIETTPTNVKIEIDPSTQEAQDILAAVDQYNLTAAQEILTSHNIRETFMEDPMPESDTSISAKLFAPGRPRQSRRLAAFNHCSSVPDLDEVITHDCQPQGLDLQRKCVSEVTGQAINSNQGLNNEECLPESISFSPQNSNNSNICVNTDSVVNNLSVLATKAGSSLQTSSMVNPHNEQSQTPSELSIQNKTNSHAIDTPDYRTQPLSAAQIQLLQNFSWQAFVAEGMKGEGVDSVKRA